MLAVYAPDPSKSLEMYETCISSVVKVLREGCRGGATDFYITCDLNVELGMMCTDENDIEELTGMCGTLCWQGNDKDPGGVKKVMWYEIMKEFNCQASSTWSVYGREEENAFTYRHLGPEKRGNFAAGSHHRTDEI